MIKIREFAVLVALLMGVAGGIFATSRVETSTRAQQQSPDHFRLLIEDLRTRSVSFSMEFAASLPTGERSRNFTTDPIRVGDDYFCFGEPWNNQTRYHCTPFDNIISVTFTE